MKRVHILNCSDARIEQAIKSAEDKNVQIVQFLGKRILESRKNHVPVHYDNLVNLFLSSSSG